MWQTEIVEVLHAYATTGNAVAGKQWAPPVQKRELDEARATR